MFLRQIFLTVLGLCSGLLVSGGVFTVLLSVGLVPRFAGKTHTGRFIFLYEEAVVAGTLVGGLLSVFDYPPQIGRWFGKWLDMNLEGEIFRRGILLGLEVFFGLFAGIFVGCLALAIAEMLDTIPVFARRIRFRHGLGIAVLFVAAGKAAGRLFYFIKGIFQAGL